MILCDLVNEGGASEFKTFEATHLPRTGDLIIKKWEQRPADWGAVLKVVGVVHREGQRVRLHVKFHINELLL